MIRRLTFVILIFSSFLLAAEKDSTIVGPGVIHYEEYRAEGPWHFDVLKIDLTNPWIKLETVKANDYLFSHERTSSMASRNDAPNHRVVGAINGDFYAGDGSPIGAQISNGEIVKTDAAWQTVGFDVFNNPMIADVAFSGTAFTDTSSNPLTSVNSARLENYLILFNNFFGSSTQTNVYGTEALLNPISEWMVNDTVACIVENVVGGQGNMSIPNGKVVLSGHGTSSQFVAGLNIGDTLRLALNMMPAPDKLNQLIGGNTRLITNGIIVGGTGDRHPRTAVGFDQDSTTLYLFTVDGRQPGYSVGMSYRELAEYMAEYGVYQGVNLDGGGSTTMIVRGSIANSPSDPGGERSVSNSMIVVSTAPDSPLAHLRISPEEVFSVGGSSVQFSVKGFDQYYNHVNIDTTSIQWLCAPELGSITSTGLFTAAEDTISGYVYAQTNYGIKDSALVHLTKVMSIEVTPNPVILKVGENQQMNAEARDNYNNVIQLSPADFNWSVTGNVGTISNSGLFTAGNEGSGEIIAEYDLVQGTVPVSVGVSTLVMIDDFSTVSNYSLSGVVVNLSQCNLSVDNSIFVSAPSSGKLEYSLTTGGTSALYLNCNIPISGTPDKIGINVYGDGKQHWLRGEFEDTDGDKFLMNFTESSPGINWSGSWLFLEKEMSEAIPSWSNPGATLDYPITWKRIYLVETDDGKKDSGVIYLDDFKVDFISTSVENEKVIPNKFKLEQNFPNPFNPTTKIGFVIPSGVEGWTTLKVFDILGKEVAVLINEQKQPGTYEIEFSTGNLPSGVYFYRLTSGELSHTKKLMLLK